MPSPVATPTISNHSHSPSQHASRSCNICFSDMDVPEFSSPEEGNFRCGLTDDRRQIRLSCGHAYCKECIEGLLDKAAHDCPTCRKPIQERDLKTINQDLGTHFKPRTARDVMNDVVNDDRRNNRRDDISRENLGLWGCDVIHTENERNPGRTQREAPALNTAFLDALLDEFVGLNLLSNSYSAFTPRQEPTAPRGLDDWFGNMVRGSDLDDLLGDSFYDDEVFELTDTNPYSYSYSQPEPEPVYSNSLPSVFSMGHTPVSFGDFDWISNLFSPRQPSMPLLSPSYSFLSPAISPLVFLF